MKFLILMTNDDAAWKALPAPEQEHVFRENRGFEEALRERGAWLAAWRLRPASEAKTVWRDAAGELETRVGTAATGGCVGGAYLIEASSLDEATEWARRGRFIAGANEVRQIWEE